MTTTTVKCPDSKTLVGGTVKVGGDRDFVVSFSKLLCMDSDGKIDEVDGPTGQGAPTTSAELQLPYCSQGYNTFNIFQALDGPTGSANALTAFNIKCTGDTSVRPNYGSTVNVDFEYPDVTTDYYSSSQIFKQSTPNTCGENSSISSFAVTTDSTGNYLESISNIKCMGITPSDNGNKDANNAKNINRWIRIGVYIAVGLFVLLILIAFVVQARKSDEENK